MGHIAARKKNAIVLSLELVYWHSPTQSDFVVIANKYGVGGYCTANPQTRFSEWTCLCPHHGAVSRKGVSRPTADGWNSRL